MRKFSEFCFEFFFEVSGKSHSAEKREKGNGFLSHVRGFGCVENEVLSTYGKSALMHKKWTDRVERTKKTSHCESRDFLRKRQLKRKVR